MPENPSSDTRLRRMLHDAAAEVQPEGGLDAIFAHGSTGKPVRHRWLPVVLAAVAAVAVAVGGVLLLNGQDGSTASSASSEPSASVDPGRSVRVPVYYLGTTASGARLFREYRTVEHATGSDVEVAVNQALGVSAADPDYRSGFPAGTTAEVTTQPGEITVHLADPSLAELPAQMSTADATTAVQAVVHTAGAVTGTQAPVVFEIAGRRAASVLGVPMGQAYAPLSADSTQSPLWIDAPTEGARVPQSFSVRGLAATFEANVVWELRQGDRVVTQGFTTARECCTLSPYSFTVQAAPGDYTLLVRDEDPSDGEGSGVTVDTKHVTVTP